MTTPPYQLLISKPDSVIEDFVLYLAVIRVGRAPDNHIVIADQGVGRHHAEIRAQYDHYTLHDLESKNGTYVNGSKLTAQTPYRLEVGDVIQIGATQLKFTMPQDSKPSPTPNIAPALLEGTLHSSPGQPIEAIISQQLDLRGQKSVTVGRDPANGIVINHPGVSRFHTQIKQNQEVISIRDLGSTNGTFVNGAAILSEQVLEPGDTIRIGPVQLMLEVNLTFHYVNEQGNLRLDALHLQKIVSKGINLLNDISLSIYPREFIVIAGVSGGGKSTLLDALSGFRPATDGQVLINGTDLYTHFDAYRSEVGYVPQKDIVHSELSVEQALLYAAELRMPADTSEKERQQRLDQVLQDLGLTHRRQVPIKNLSGGQLKRVSMGVELITKPSLFFLDEATSGLDPGTEADIMQLLRKLADQGSTIVLITHATENVTLANQVVFLGAGGRVAYFGPPKKAVEYFEVAKFSEIYHKVEREGSPQEWQQRYLDSPYYQAYVAQRQGELDRSKSVETGGRARKGKSTTVGKPQSTTKQISDVQQFWILLRRNVAILLRDRIGLVLMLAVAPVLGLLDFVTWQADLFDVQSGDPEQAVTMLFTTALIAVMVGSLSTMREIVKEVDIYRRERMIGLRILPYIASKLGISVILALYQAAVFLLLKLLSTDIPLTLSSGFSFYFTLFLASLSGMIMGLLVSAVSPNQNVAPLLTIIVLVPQITFGGGILPLNKLGPPGLLINHVSLTKWTFESMVTISDLGQSVDEDPCWQLSAAARRDLEDEDKDQCLCLGINLFDQCQFPGIQEKGDDQEVLDATPPAEVMDPGDPPAKPADLALLDQWQQDMETYQEQINAYANYQADYNQWKADRLTAIAKREATIERFQTDFGIMFAVNLVGHWLALLTEVAAMLGLIWIVQKRKDGSQGR